MALSPGELAEGIVLLMRKLCVMKLSYFLSKETDRETEQKSFLKGNGHTVSVSNEERKAMPATGTPYNCCPVVHPVSPVRITVCLQALPQFLHILTTAKPGSVSAEKACQRNQDNCHL